MFEETVSHLARYVCTWPQKLSSVASKAMSAIMAPVVEGPDRPTRKYWTDSARMAKTSNKTSGTGNTIVELAPVREDWKHDLNVEDYTNKRRAFQEQAAAWKENKAKCYYLVLSHCPKELEQELQNLTKWTETEDNPDVVALLMMIRDITHKRSERTA